MQSRRAFLASALAAGGVPVPTWADAGDPRYISAAQRPNGSYVLCGLMPTGDIAFEIPLPARGHAATAHPRRPEAVAFARRPGTFAFVIDCRSGTPVAQLTAPHGRHFYGHGAFSAEGDLLFTTENDFENATGVVGVWDARNGYRRVGEYASGGVGPHDIKLMPEGKTLAVANGGIETHPETGRAKLNIPTMRPNLSLIGLIGDLNQRVELDPSLSRNSIRHLAVGADDTVAFAMQWQGDASELVPLLGLHRADGTTQLIAPSPQMRGYLGSGAMDTSGQRVAITAPRGGLCQVLDTTSGSEVFSAPLPDVCGVAAGVQGFIVTTGDGVIVAGLASDRRDQATSDLKWDNHLIRVGYPEV